jgi:hypothetical protein
MTGDQSRTLNVGDRVCWKTDRYDQGTVTEKNWAGVTITIVRITVRVFTGVGGW